ncbi:transcriptional regulator [Lactobacillus sp.] [Lactiplantibacillus mudanjiangensis]|uniref:helix-turn-helix domain-containing protein n=1 Tax=Lactiplantibacillus mudanjiangensis TaxID=1296538 RepID=UPI0010144A47|nr:helix-turn-helix transcriptional regulator [Lactiplantibacillus mudanjiangensis]VDG18947.1 transcriptional regulator [Lactobacillus sp.] [Lactiplantibacillus mudanjiangensis]VDG33048.1 transcriptional regulator [Lactobacillus sp.] [Lactiplantibacillus mudanjiangensis]
MFPERLRALRRGQKMTLGELATALNNLPDADLTNRKNTAAQIGNWERNLRTPSYLEVRKLAEFFHVTTDYLSGRADQAEYDLGRIFLSGKPLTFNQESLSSEDRYELFQLMDGYLHGRQYRTTDDAVGQEELDLHFDN